MQDQKLGVINFETDWIFLIFLQIFLKEKELITT